MFSAPTGHPGGPHLAASRHKHALPAVTAPPEASGHHSPSCRFPSSWLLHHVEVGANFVPGVGCVPAIVGSDGSPGFSSRPQNCSLECIRQGRPECGYCRVTGDDIKKKVGLSSNHGCIPWPCLELLGDEDPSICEHYVQAPDDVKVEFVHDSNPKSDSVIVSWKPSHYGIAFLRGFQVSVQALGGTAVACQLLLFSRNVSLSAAHAQTFYKSDPFPGLSLGSQYAVTVMALPVPEQWDKFYQSFYFKTRSCAAKNGLEQCKQDWYPQQVEVQQNGSVVIVTFNLAPPTMEIRRYFCVCHGDGEVKYTDIILDSLQNKTHHSFQLSGLRKGTNYSCEIAANEVDAVRKRFKISVQKEILPSTPPSSAVVFTVCLAVVVVSGVVLAALMCWYKKKLDANPEIDTLNEEKDTLKEQVVLPLNRPTPPRLLICYSHYDGEAHVKAVMQLGAFIQQHMATQQIAANEVDAVRKRFKISVQKEILPSTPPSSAVVFAVCLAVVVVSGVVLAALMCWYKKKLDANPEIDTLNEEKDTLKEQVVLPLNRPTPPRLLICYSHYDGEAHVKAVMQLGAFIQQHMATQVCLDLWDYLSIAEEGIMAWHCRQIRESDFVLVICSPGLRQRYDPEVTHSDSVDLMSNACSCSAIVQLIGEEVGRAKARGEDMSKYMAAVFKYCKETDIPTELRLASHYTLPHDLPLLFSHLQGVALHRPGSYLKINNITEEGYTGVPMGAALQLAIQEAGTALNGKQQQMKELKCDRVDA
ncbi:interleukin-17 receptor D [Poecilia formosa]|uniref:interleukin-17 receptor D n=1 Tax=Poecilia formosa TaxID=48698 RepID=UPI000443E4BC|nr:PREDICTED: interleukin-17 receptor D-like [Poecilia formosa]